MGFVFVCVFRMRFPRDRFVHSRRYSRRRFFVYTYLSASTVSGVRAHALRCSSHLFFPASSYAHSCCMRYMRFLCAARSINGYVHRRVRLRRLHCCGAQPERSIARVGDLPLRVCVWCVAINNARAIPLSICQEQPFNAYILWASGVYAHNTYAGARAIPHTRKQSVLSLSVSRWLQDQPKWPIKNGCLSVLTFTCMCVLLLPACLPATVTQRFMYCLMVSLSHFVVHIRLHAHTAHTHTHTHIVHWLLMHCGVSAFDNIHFVRALCRYEGDKTMTAQLTLRPNVYRCVGLRWHISRFEWMASYRFKSFVSPLPER